MAEPVLLKNAVDSYVKQKDPGKNYSSLTRLQISDAAMATQTQFGFIYFGVPSGIVGTQVISAKMRLYSGHGWSGSSTVTLTRTSEKFISTKVTWDNRPGITGSALILNKSSPAYGTMWEWDVTAVMQQVANGAAWYGFRISSSDNGGWFHSAQAEDWYRPQLEITYTSEPSPPSVLIPSSGQVVAVAKPVLQWDFTDTYGNTNMAAYNLRLFSTLALANANGAGDVLDVTTASGWPQVDLNDTAYGGLANTATVWWRVRVQDGAGYWSGWSAVAYFTRQNKGTLAVTNPPVSPAEVTDPTPTIAWTFSGQTQRAYEVIIAKPETPGNWLWTSGVVTSADLYVTPPPGIVNMPGQSYRLTVRVYDTQNRRSTPNDPVYTELTRDFTLSLSAAVPPVTGFTVTPDAFRPWAVLNWSKTPAPDYFAIMRDGVIVAVVLAADVFVSGTAYQYIDRGAKPRISHTWSVAVIADGVTSTGNPTDVDMVRLITTHLSDIYGGHEVFLFNPDVAAARAESSEVHYILGKAPPVLITQALRGYEGSLTGIVAQDLVAGLSADTQLANLEYFKDNPGLIVRLSWVDKSMQVVLYNVTDSPIPYADGKLDHLVSMSFFQTDF